MLSIISPRSAVRTLLAAAAILPFAAQPLRAAYNFTNIVDSTMDPDVSSYNRVLLDGDTIAIQKSGEIFTISDGLRTTIAKIGDPAPTGTFTNVGPIGISLSGKTVAFYGLYSRTWAIFTGSGGPRTMFATRGTPTPAGEITITRDNNYPSIDGASVAFAAEHSLGGGGVFVSDGQTISTIAKTGDPLPDSRNGWFEFFGRPTIQGDRVAFMGNYDVMLSQGGELKSITRSEDPGPLESLAIVGPLKISGNAVAFEAVGDDPTAYDRTMRGIFVGNGDSLKLIVRTGNPSRTPRESFRYISLAGIADDGQTVAFSGTNWASEGGAFISHGGQISKVLKTGDTLFGQHLTSASARAFDPRGSGRLVVGYALANGVTGIAMATPVPEPAAGVMLALSAALAAASLRHARRVAPS
jgi:hypothetical protein